MLYVMFSLWRRKQALVTQLASNSEAKVVTQMWMDIAIVASIFAVGSILFGHFEEGTPKWRRVTKFFVTIGLVALISSTAGSVWVVAFIGTMSLGALIVHAWWLPRHGINGWTGEPRDKYYELRGWKRPAPEPHSARPRQGDNP